MILALSLLQQLNGNKILSIYLLSDSFHEGVVNLPQIKVVFKDIELDLETYDALIFSSKNSVKAIDKINSEWKKIPAYSIGQPTSKEIEKYGGNLVYTAKSSYGDNFAKEILSKLTNKKVLFLRAKKILSNLEKILKDGGIQIESQIVYETICNEQISLHVKKEKSAFIFTSPSTVECFLKHYEWQNDYIAICIGNVTANALPKNIPAHISKIQTIPACIELAKRVIKQN
jgi:uroporphyrinogen-III synthase